MVISKAIPALGAGPEFNAGELAAPSGEKTARARKAARLEARKQRRSARRVPQEPISEDGSVAALGAADQTDAFPSSDSPTPPGRTDAEPVGEDPIAPAAASKRQRLGKVRRRARNQTASAPYSADSDGGEVLAGRDEADAQADQSPVRAAPADSEAAATDSDELLVGDSDQPDTADLRPLAGELPSVLSVCSLGPEPDTGLLFAALTEAFQPSGIVLSTQTEGADLAIAFPGTDPSLLRHAKIRCVLGSANSTLVGDEPRLKLSKAVGAIYVPWHGVIAAADQLTVSGMSPDLKVADYQKVASVIRDGVLAELGYALPRPQKARISKSEDPAVTHAGAELLNFVDWPGQHVPASLSTTFEVEEFEHFIEGNLRLLHPEGHRPLAFHLPFSWHLPMEGAVADSLYGLHSVSNVLVYWLQRANRVPLKGAAHLEVLLKERGITASGLLVGAGAIILDFLNTATPLPLTAWSVGAVRQRAIAFELFLLCCKAAAERRIRFNPSACEPVFEGLVELLSLLRGASTRALGSAQSTGETIRLAGLAVPLRQTPYGADLLKETLATLEFCHLRTGMAADGVWLEGFLQHCAIVASLRALAGDLRVARVAAPFLPDAILKLATFADLFVTSTGFTPGIAEHSPIQAKRIVAVPRTALQKAGPAATPANQGIFRESGYFISRSGKSHGKTPSHLVVLARPPSRGGMSLSFSVGPTPVLIGGGTIDPKAPAGVREAALEQPGAHNAVRIDGLLYAQAVAPDGEIRLTEEWHDKDWAAVRLLCEAFAPLTVKRTVIHLRSTHSLIVVDELVSPKRDAKFDQFWHLAPGLNAHSAPIFFSAQNGAIVSVAFDGGSVEGPITDGQEPIGWTAEAKRKLVRNPYLICSATTRNGLMAAFFNCGSRHVGAELSARPLEHGWRVDLRAPAMRAGFAFEKGRLTTAS